MYNEGSKKTVNCFINVASYFSAKNLVFFYCANFILVELIPLSQRADVHL